MGQPYREPAPEGRLVLKHPRQRHSHAASMAAETAEVSPRPARVWTILGREALLSSNSFRECSHRVVGTRQHIERSRSAGAREGRAVARLSLSLASGGEFCIWKARIAGRHRRAAPKVCECRRYRRGDATMTPSVIRCTEQLPWGTNGSERHFGSCFPCWVSDRSHSCRGNGTQQDAYSLFMGSQGIPSRRGGSLIVQLKQRAGGAQAT